MTYYEDLRSCDYFGPTDGQLLAVGWLDREHAISKGQVTPQFFESLARLVANVWQPFVLAGRHPCEFCIFTGGPSEGTRSRGAAMTLCDHMYMTMRMHLTDMVTG